MQPYEQFNSESELFINRGGVCPYCKKHTGWHVRKMGVIPNFKDNQFPEPDSTSTDQLRRKGFTACKIWGIPGIIVNTCMACNSLFYDYVFNKEYTCRNNGLTSPQKHVCIERIYPKDIHSNIPEANIDMPQSCTHTYNEAKSIFEYSPRSAAVLLRLCLQSLLNHLGFKGNIYDMIGEATVKLHLPVHIQQFMDVVRYKGNEAAHDCDLELNPDEDKGNAAYMFEIINIVTERAITIPKASEDSYKLLPENVRKAIETRDKSNNLRSC